ncbi:MAG: alpha/beta hydrolase [Alphaproteobacteria bacterium]|nr:alpha/beta hydrolase [Alphaproteobacteria bacterium]
MPSPELEHVLATLFAAKIQKSTTMTLAEMREGYETYGRFFPPEPGVEPQPVSAGGVPAAWLAAPQAAADRVVLYLHGGGFRLGSITTHLSITSRLTDAAAARVLALDYRLAPEHKFPAQLDDARAAYQWLLDQGIAPTRIAVVGDSAGGGLTISLQLDLRARDLPLPSCSVAISPWVDLVGTGTWREADPCCDPTVDPRDLDDTIADYLGDADPRQDLVSPVFADLTGLPPLLIQVGTQEILRCDAEGLAARARACGVDVTLEVEEGAFHVWHHAAPKVPESLVAIARIGDFVRRHAG